MLIGIDMGGTNIDGVVISEGKIINRIKNPVDKDDLYKTIVLALEELISPIDKEKIERINLSTTISTNAIVEGKNSDVLMILQTGPGINYAFQQNLKNVEYVSGYTDHRGKSVKNLNLKELEEIKNKKIYKDINNLGVVSKFSVRNPEPEIEIAKFFEKNFESISMGHTLSGKLNFPRRVNTTYLNASVSNIFSEFLFNIGAATKKEKLNAPIFILKADGGTMDFETALKKPVESILSGPAASFTGINALTQNENDAILLDIGGTTTDIFFLIDGSPLFEPQGIEIHGYKTLIRSIFSYSIGLGGDSFVEVCDNEIKVGPERKDKPLIFGGKFPTVTDAFSIIGKIDTAEKERAIPAFSKMAEQLNLNVEEFSYKVIEKASQIIKSTVDDLLYKINQKPVYTVKEVLENRKVIPENIKIIGGPSQAFKPFIEEKFNLPVLVPKNFDIANAIGAALSNPTTEINLQADTLTGKVNIPEANIYMEINRRFSIEDARKLAIETVEKMGRDMGYENATAEITEENDFNMIDNYSFGKNMRIKAQIKPGLLYNLRGDDFEN